MVYINYKGGEGKETVDEATTRKEAESMLKDYRQSDPTGNYEISSRCCNNWKEKD